MTYDELVLMYNKKMESVELMKKLFTFLSSDELVSTLVITDITDDVYEMSSELLKGYKVYVTLLGVIKIKDVLLYIIENKNHILSFLCSKYAIKISNIAISEVIESKVMLLYRDAFSTMRVQTDRGIDLPAYTEDVDFNLRVQGYSSTDICKLIDSLMYRTDNSKYSYMSSELIQMIEHLGI